MQDRCHHMQHDASDSQFFRMTGVSELVPVGTFLNTRDAGALKLRSVPGYQDTTAPPPARSTCEHRKSLTTVFSSTWLSCKPSCSNPNPPDSSPTCVQVERGRKSTSTHRISVERVQAVLFKLRKHAKAEEGGADILSLDSMKCG